MIICIDTITHAAGISLVSDRKALGFLPMDNMNASDSILVNIDRLLKANNVSLPNLKGIMVIMGPGSFTGLRVGLAVANQLSHQLKIPVVGLKTDEWYRYRHHEEATYLQSMNRDEIYMEGMGIRKLDDVIGSLADRKWTGELSQAHAEKLKDIGTQLINLEPPEVSWHQAYLDRQSNFEKHSDYQLVEPFYGKEPTITKSKRKLSI